MLGIIDNIFDAIEWVYRILFASCSNCKWFVHMPGNDYCDGVCADQSGYEPMNTNDTCKEWKHKNES